MRPQLHFLSNGRTILSTVLAGLICRKFAIHSFAPLRNFHNENSWHFKESDMSKAKKSSTIKKKRSDIKYEVRPMRKEDIPQALDIWEVNGVHGAVHNLHPWLAFDPNGMQVAVKDSGEVLGTCAGVINNDNLAFFGAYTVREEYRLLGIGLKICTACMERIGARNTAGNAVPGKEELHRDKFKIPIVENKWKLLVNEIYEDISPENLSDEVPNGICVQHCRNSHLPLIYKYDFNLVGYRRDLAIKLTYEEEDTKSLVAIKDGECVGFGVIKKTCRGVHHLGPLYANDAAVAEAILKRLIMSAPEIKGLYMATVSNNAPANDFLKKLGSPTVEICTRVFRRRNDDEEMTNVDTDRVFALFDMHYTPF